MILLNGKDVSGRVEKVQRVGPFGRVLLLDVDRAGRFVVTRKGSRRRWAWGRIREVADVG